LRHLAWDADVASKAFEPSPAAKSSFVSTDGGLTLFSGGDYSPAQDPYNSSVYRLTASGKKPAVHVKRYVIDAVSKAREYASESARVRIEVVNRLMTFPSIPRRVTW